MKPRKKDAHGDQPKKPKPNRTPSRPVYLRLDVDVGDELEDFVEWYQQVHGLKVTMAAHMQKAIVEYMAKYRPKE